MKIKDNLTSEIKMRVTDTQKRAITQAAKSHNLSTSDFLRSIILKHDALSSYALTIRRNLIKNEFHNLIQSSTELPRRYKEIIFKEIDKID